PLTKRATGRWPQPLGRLGPTDEFSDAAGARAPWADVTDSQERPNRSETGANARLGSPSWGSLGRAQYNPLEKPCRRASLLLSQATDLGWWQGIDGDGRHRWQGDSAALRRVVKD